jgi:hypothetical protein
MELRLRPYATAGVALVGAGAIAMAPVAPPLPDIKVASPSVNLSATIDPFTPWEELIETSFGNVAGLVGDWGEAPLPVIQQIIVNQFTYLSELPDFELIAGQIVDNFEAAAGVLYERDLTTLDDFHNLAFQLLPSIVPALADLGPVLDFTTTSLSGVLLGLVGPIIAPVLALAASGSAIFAELTSAEPDIGAAFNTLINTPAAMADAFLNGGQTLDLTPVLSALGPALGLDLPEGLETGVTFGGLLSPGGSIFNALDIGFGELFNIRGQGPGAIGSLVDLSQAIARALGWSGTGNPLAVLNDAPPPPPALQRSDSPEDTSLLKASTTSIVTTTDTVTDAQADADATGVDTTASTDGAPTVDTGAGSGATTEAGETEVEEAPAVIGDEEADGGVAVTKPTKKKVNPGAKLAGALKNAGDQIRSAVNDLGKMVTKRPTKKAPTAEKGTDSSNEKPSDRSSEKASAGGE